MLKSMALVAAGAGIGGVARWLLGLGLNGLFPLVPMGTLAANLSGGFLAGVMLAAMAHFPLPGEARLFLMTGLLGGLTTFSTFSAEVTALLHQRHLASAALAMVLHVGGSLLMTFAGLTLATMVFADR